MFRVRVWARVVGLAKIRAACTNKTQLHIKHSALSQSLLLFCGAMHMESMHY